MAAKFMILVSAYGLPLVDTLYRFFNFSKFKGKLNIYYIFCISSEEKYILTKSSRPDTKAASSTGVINVNNGINIRLQDQ